MYTNDAVSLRPVCDERHILGRYRYIRGHLLEVLAFGWFDGQIINGRSTPARGWLCRWQIAHKNAPNEQVAGERQQAQSWRHRESLAARIRNRRLGLEVPIDRIAGA